MLRSLLATALITFAVITAASAQTTTPAPSSEGPVVVASGEATVKRAPDRAFLTVTVESRAKGPREAQKVNAEAMTAVLQKLKSSLPEDAIRTHGYDLQPEYDYRDGRQTLRGYLARNSVELRVDDIAKVGELLDVAVGSGATSVGNVRFDLKDRAGAEREALRQAVADARRRAEAAASGVGMTVDRVVRIEEQRTRIVPPPVPYAMMESRAAAAADSAPPVAPGELEIRASATLVAAIK